MSASQSRSKVKGVCLCVCLIVVIVAVNGRPLGSQDELKKSLTEDRWEKMLFQDNEEKTKSRTSSSSSSSSRFETSSLSLETNDVSKRPLRRSREEAIGEVIDISVIHVTDVHGWVGGHPHKPDLDVDLGDLATLIELKKKKSSKGSEIVWAFDGGDFVDGTGYSDSTSVHGELIMDLIPKMPYSFSIIGNHDSEHESTVNAMKEKAWFEAWQGRLVTTNVFWSDGSRPGVSHSFLHVGETPWVVLGFMYNFDQAAGGLEVMNVDEALLLPEIVDAIKTAEQGGGGVIVIAHADPQDCCEIQDIRSGVREVVPDSTTLLIFAGHRHRKVWQDEFEDATWVIESGAYLEEVGVLSFSVDTGVPGLLFDPPEHSWVKAQVSEFAALVDVEPVDFHSELGDSIKQTVADLEEEFGLTKVVGCSDQTWTSWGSPDAPDNVYQLWIHQVIAEHLFDPEREDQVDGSVYIVNGFTFRYSIYEGDVTRNDVFTALPFNSTMSYFPGLDGAKVQTVYDTLNKAPWRRTPVELEAGKMYDVVASDYDAFVFHKLWVGQVFPDDPIEEPLPYTRPRAETQMMFEFIEQHWASPCSEQ